MNEKYRDIILGTLSFYDALTREEIILQIDKELALENSNFSLVDLDLILKELHRQKKIKRSVINSEEAWLKLFPRRSLIQRIRRLLGL